MGALVAIVLSAIALVGVAVMAAIMARIVKTQMDDEARVRGVADDVKGVRQEVSELRKADAELRASDDALRKADIELRASDLELRKADAELRKSDAELRKADEATQQDVSGLRAELATRGDALA